MIRHEAEIAILGAGFTGSLLALLLHKQGRRVVLLERGRHPRFALGESSTPLANLALEEIAAEYDLPWLADFAEYGRWKRAHPHRVCGLKRGFTFARHRPNEPYRPCPDHTNELLVTASPTDDVADTHWLRADFDLHLVEQARAAGVPYVDQVDVAVERANGWRLSGTREGEPVEVTAAFVVDATGARGALSKALYLDCVPMRTRSWSVYSHFVGVALWEDVLCDLGGRTDEHPYPCDAAALHHVLDEGWVYVLRFDNGVTSAGILFEGEPTDGTAEGLWERTLARYPGLRRQFARAEPVLPWVKTGRLQRRVSRAAGADWALLAPAAYTLDALYSTGNTHALLTMQRLARLLGGGVVDVQRLREYESTLFREIDFLDRLVHGSYQAFRDFDVLAAFTMYYFAGAIAAEERKKQGRAGPHEEVLTSHDAEFRGRFERACEMVATADAEAFAAQVAADIAPWNTVGLGDRRKRNLYPY